MECLKPYLSRILHFDWSIAGSLFCIYHLVDLHFFTFNLKQRIDKNLQCYIHDPLRLGSDAYVHIHSQSVFDTQTVVSGEWYDLIHNRLGLPIFCYSFIMLNDSNLSMTALAVQSSIPDSNFSQYSVTRSAIIIWKLNLIIISMEGRILSVLLLASVTINWLHGALLSMTALAVQVTLSFHRVAWWLLLCNS